MKTLFTSFLALIITTTLFAQAPDMFNYQGLARDLSGNPMVNKNIGLRISILQGSTTGVEVYKEIHQISTNNFGLFNIHIGKGTGVTGNIGTINWGNGDHYLKIELDENYDGKPDHIENVKPNLLTGPVTFETDPAGVEVWIDEQFIGLTPVTLNLTAGAHIFRLKKPGYKEQAYSVPFKEGKPYIFRYALQKTKKVRYAGS